MKYYLIIFLVLVGLIWMFNGCTKDNEETIMAELVISPEELYFNDEDTVTLYLSTTPEKKVSWEATSSSSWLEMQPSSGTLDGQIMTVKVISHPEGLDAGIHYSEIEVISSGAGKNSAKVYLAVESTPRVEVTPASLSFPVGTDVQQLQVKNTGYGYLTWQLLASEGWLLFEPSSGTSITGQSFNVNVSVNRDLMAIGDYTATISIVSNAGNSVDDIPVDMTVPENPDMSFSKDTIDFNYFNDELGVYIRNTGNIPYSWELFIDDAYLGADLHSGTLQVGDSTLIHFTVDREQLVPGSYTTGIRFENDEGGESVLAVSVYQYEEQKWLLQGKIVDAEYDRMHDVIISVTESPYKLLKLDPVNKSLEEVALNLLPTCVSVNPAGTRAAVGHDGYVSYVDLEAMTVINVYSSNEIAGDIVIAPNDYAYVFPATGQWTKIMCINMLTGVKDQSTGYSINDGTRAKLHPSGQYIYGADNGISPSDFEKYDISTGVAAYMYDSPYHGDYSFSGDIWIADDGIRLFARSRNVFFSSTNQSTDMTYNGQLTGSTIIVTLDHSSAANRIYYIGTEGDNWEYYPSDEVRMYEAEYMNFTGTQMLPGFIIPGIGGVANYTDSEGHFGFFNSQGTKFYVLVRAREGSGLINDWAVATLEVQ